MKSYEVVMNIFINYKIKTELRKTGFWGFFN